MTEPFPNICPQCLVLLSHMRGGLMACARSWDLINKLYGSALVDQLGEGERIPVGKPNAAMRIRFCSRSVPVNSITLSRPIGRSSSPA